MSCYGIMVVMGFKNKIHLRRLLPAVAISVGIFWFGWAIGANKIGPNSVYRKTENKQLPANLSYSSVEKVYDTLRESYDGKLDINKLLDGLKSGLAQSTGDPYTEYLTSEEAKQFNDDLNGSFTGIGAELSKDAKTKQIVVVAPISGFPAEQAGIQTQDIIAEVNGENASTFSITEAVNKIRGEAGTVVKLKIIREGSKEFNFSITRAKIVIPSVKTKILEGNIGYMQISTFANDTVELLSKSALEFKQKNVSGIIVDVRNNPGGLLDDSISAASLWLNDRVVLYEKRDGKTIKTYRSDSAPVLDGVPTVVLINGGSASASEILAGALRDNDAATLIGKKSFGKGSVQQLVDLGDGSQLKVTIAKWYTPNDKNISKEGIEPDTKVEITDKDIVNKEDPQLDAALKFLTK